MTFCNKKATTSWGSVQGRLEESPVFFQPIFSIGSGWAATLGSNSYLE
jgi:hypothetical protein